MTEKFAVMIHDMRGGGGERTMLNLATGIADKGHDVDLVLERAEGEFLSLVPGNVRIVALNTRHGLQTTLALARYLRRERPAGLITALVKFNNAGVVARRLARVSTKIVITEHFATLQHLDMNKARDVHRRYRLAHWLYPWADEIVAVSRGVAGELASFIGIPEDRIRVINNPVIRKDLPVLASETPDHPWLQTQEIPVILGVGRLSHEKDFPTLIRAFAVLRAQRQARLIIVGIDQGRVREELLGCIEELGVGDCVDLPGFTLNPYAMMSRASVFALSSKHEGLGNVLIEALACGTQVVSTDCPIGPSEVLDGGRYGRLTPVGDAPALATAMVAALDDPIPVSDLRARAADFSVERAAEEYLRLFSI